MNSIALPDQETLYDKILGCWMGKNCGGTLGGPLEKCYSEAEPFNASYYSEIREGGIPNDDLEIQLIWLKAVEEIGLDLTAHDLAQYWLDHVAYNFDEYGLMMTNLRFGLLPPVAGYYNNYFRDCMGCPIRTEIWACIAPGQPRLAARYALLDSIVDHAGGESLYGSLFNVTVEAAAFSVSDVPTLIDIGLSYLPKESLTARCLRAVLAAHADGGDWLEARRRVIEIGYHINAQFSPPNIAFQVIGWLYGKDFGDALCKAVNCGYDTDCTGATLGSFLGIIMGAKALPERWAAPLGDALATSDPNGVKNLYLPPNPSPRSITELTDRVIRIQKLVEARFGAAPTDLASLYADAATLQSVNQPPTVLTFPLTHRLDLTLDYLDTPQIAAGETKEIRVTAHSRHPEPMPATLRVQTPVGWTATPATIPLTLHPHQPWTGTVTVHAPERAHLANSQSLYFHLQPERRPVLSPSPLVLIGAPTYLKSTLFPADGKTAAELIDHPFAPETAIGSLTEPNARGTEWSAVLSDGNDVTGCLSGFKSGVVYLRSFLHSDQEQNLWLHTCSRVPAKVWLNGKVILESKATRPLRPAAWGSGEGGLHGELPVRAGWNEVLMKFAADDTCPPFACHVLYSDKKRLHAGVTDLLRPRFPWDE
ncbi:MAG: hypothetical protein B9S32_09820 [Verrucomicrobia bacterium Tous-C9LFEB]|nr:MAG: hypothetical protein B9S32_09820 [Verrucomicrobia bacterium Tous-C9LFEB]